jgi:iron complex outermembrane receptor protein
VDRKLFLIVSLLVLIPAAGKQVYADDDLLILEEVFVTAQKREQRIQDVPLSISLVSGKILNEFNIQTTADLDNFVPGLVIQETPQNLNTITIRGVGTASGNETYDQSVSLFIDGVYAGRQREFQTALFDIERIEVIKGSQNTLMGKNTSLGAISLVTKKPGKTHSAYLESSYEIENTSYALTAAVDIPAGNSSTRIAFNHIDENGYIENIATGNDLAQRNQDTLRLITLLDISAGFTLEAMYQYDDLEILGDLFQPVNDELGIIRALDPLTELSLDDKKSSFMSVGKDGETFDVQHSQRAALTFTAELNDHLFTAITGWSEYDNNRVIDSDFTFGDYLLSAYDTDFNQITQEFRLATTGKGLFEYLVGMFFLRSDYSNTNLIDANFPDEEKFLLYGIAVQGATTKTFEQKTRVKSLFAQANRTLSERLELTLGVRWTDEDKDALYGNAVTRPGPALAVMPAFPPTDLSRNEKSVDGSINFQYGFAKDSMAYVSWSKGTKSGGFTDAAVLPEDAEFDAEIARTTELGAKMFFLGGIANLNVAAFYIDIKDFQVVTFTGLYFDIGTVPAQSTGFEADGYFVLSESTRIYGGFTYADAKQTDTGDQLPQSPKISASGGIRYEKPLYHNSDLRWSVDGIASYRDEMYHQMAQSIQSDSSSKLDIRLALKSRTDSWEVALLARNVTNERSSSFGFEYPLFGEIYGGEQMVCYGLEPMRTISLQAGLNFK